MAKTALLVNLLTPVQHVRLIRYFSKAYAFFKKEKTDAFLKSTLNEHKNATVIATGLGAEKWLNESNVSFCTPEDYLEDAMYQRIDQSAAYFANNWYKKHGDIFSYDGISLGEMAGAEFSHFFYFLVEVLKSIEAMKAIMEKEKPESVMAVNNVKHGEVNSLMKLKDENIMGRVATMVAEAKGIPASEHDFSTVPNLKYTLETFYFGTIQVITSFLTRLPGLSKGQKRDKKDVNRIVGIGRGRHLIYLIPVIRELRRNQKNEVTIVGVGSEWTMEEYRRLRAEQVEVKAFENYINHGIKNRVKKAKKTLWEVWLALKNNKDFRDFFTYQDVAFWDLVKDRLEYMFSQLFVEITKNIEIAKRILEEGADIIVVTAEVGHFEKPIIRLASMYGVPTLDILHGVPATPYGVLPVTVDKLAVWGTIGKDWFIEHGISPDRLVVTGQPRFDEIANGYQKDNKGEIYQQLRLDSNKRLIVVTPPAGVAFTSIRTATERKLFAQEVLKAFKQFPGYQLVIKPHGSDQDINLYYDMVNRMRMHDAVITNNINLYDLLDACDILISEPHTTAILEAMILGKPVITVNLSGAPDLMPYARSGAAIGVYKPEGIAPAIRKVLSDQGFRKELEKNRQRFVYSYAYEQDGQASRRVASLIEEMIEESRASGGKS